MDSLITEAKWTEPEKTVPASSHNKEGKPVWIMVGQAPFSALSRIVVVWNFV